MALTVTAVAPRRPGALPSWKGNALGWFFALLLIAWSSQTCVWFYLEFPESRWQTLPRQDLIVSSETRSLIRRRALNLGTSLKASERPMRLFEPLFAPPRNVLVQLDGQGVLSLRMRLML